METLKLKDWLKQGEELFGKNKKNWKFKCPVCGGIQTLKEFEDNNIEDASQKFYFSCIGRWVKGRGCDWTLGGFLQIHKLEVISDESKKVPVFEFAND